MSLANRAIRCPFAYDYTDELEDDGEHSFARGGFASVFKAKVKGKEVAVKVLRSDLQAELFKAEYDCWHRLRHPNILPLEGICYFRSETKLPSFVSSFQRNGTISTYVKNKPHLDIIHLFERIALAIDYLHANGIIHNDIRATNILVSDAEEPLLTDFGIAKHDYGDGVQMSTAMNGNYRWMAHEFFKDSSPIGANKDSVLRTRASDIWSFGMTMREIMTGKYPYYEHKEAQVILIIEKGELPSFPNALHESWARYENPLNKLCLLCWALDPGYRPDAEAIASRLRTMRKDLADRVEPAHRAEGMVSRLSTPRSSLRGDHIASSTSSGPSSPLQDRQLSSRKLSGEPTLTLSDMITRPDMRRSRLASSDDSTPFVESPEETNAPSPSSSQATQTPCLRSLSLQGPRLARASTMPSSSSGDWSDSIPPEWMVDPQVELQNFLAREGMLDLLRAEQKEQYTNGPWYTRLYFDGEEVGYGSGPRKTSSFSAAAKAALPRIRRIRESTRTQTANFTDFTPLDPSRLSECKEDYTCKGPQHSLTWTCVLRVGYEELCRGHGTTKIEAKQDARVRLRYAYSTGSGSR